MVIDIGQIVHTLPRLTVNVYDIMLLTKQQPEWREEKTNKKKKTQFRLLIFVFYLVLCYSYPSNFYIASSIL